MKITGYREVPIKELRDKMLSLMKDDKSVTKVDIAYALKKSTQTIDNAFAINDNSDFVASDRIVCQVAEALGIRLAIVENGKKMYFVNYNK